MEPRQSFYVNRFATGWWWSQPMSGSGMLECYDGLLRFERYRLFGRGRVYEHRAQRVVLSSPTTPFPNHYTIVTFEEGIISVSIPGNRELLRTTLRECGFEIIETPPRRSWVRNHRELWMQCAVVGTPQPAAPPPAGG